MTEIKYILLGWLVTTALFIATGAVKNYAGLLT
jgi:hypothetical protein